MGSELKAPKIKGLFSDARWPAADRDGSGLRRIEPWPEVEAPRRTLKRVSEPAVVFPTTEPSPVMNRWSNPAGLPGVVSPQPQLAGRDSPSSAPVVEEDASGSGAPSGTVESALIRLATVHPTSKTPTLRFGPAQPPPPEIEVPIVVEAPITIDRTAHDREPAGTTGASSQAATAPTVIVEDEDELILPITVDEGPRRIPFWAKLLALGAVAAMVGWLIGEGVNQQRRRSATPSADHSAEAAATLAGVPLELDTSETAPVEKNDRPGGPAAVSALPPLTVTPGRVYQREHPAGDTRIEVEEGRWIPAKKPPRRRRTAAPLPEHPSRSEVERSLLAVRDELAGCVAPKHGEAEVRVTVAPSGRVTTAVVHGHFAGTPEGSCIARTVRLARFPRFSKARFVVDFPFQL